jgi:type I restriction enzyme S subunit
LCRAKPEYELLYLKHYLASRFGAASLTKAQIGSTHPHINVRRLVELPIPLPSQPKQYELAATMESARAERRAKLAEADALLAGLDGYVLDTLGLTLPPKDERKTFAVRLADIGNRTIGANFYAPPLRYFLRTLSGSKFKTPRLRDAVALNPKVDVSQLMPDSLVSFVPMDAVAEAAEGSMRLHTRTLSEVQKGYTPFSDGDVLWAKITPCMENGKSCIASGLTNGVGFGSTEFHVLRPRTDAVRVEYLHAFLSLVSLRQVARFAFTGSAGHQRVPEDFLAELPFPIPDPAIQEAIVTETRRRREEARRLRAEAEADWQAAKRWFEEQLLGPG